MSNLRIGNLHTDFQGTRRILSNADLYKVNVFLKKKKPKHTKYI